MSEQNETPVKRPRGRPKGTGKGTWTKAQKEAFEKRVQKQNQDLVDFEGEFIEKAKAKRPKQPKRTQAKAGRPKWTAQDRKNNAETWTLKKMQTDAEYMALIEANPDKTRTELGIPPTWLTPAEREELEQKKNSYYLRIARVAMDLPPVDLRELTQIEDRIKLYFQFCERVDRVPNITGLANWLGVNQRTLTKWKMGDYGREGYAELIQKTCMAMEEMLVSQMQDNKVNPANGIFILKNHYQYKDQQNVVVQDGGVAEDSMSMEDIAKRYAVETTFTEEKDDAD